MHETQMLRYILEQPRLLRSLLKNRETGTAAAADRFRAVSPDRVIVIGSGSSYHAALMARPVMERALGIEVTCTVPSEAGHFAYCSMRSPLFLAVSQSGLSTNIYELVQNLRARGAAVIAVTQSSGTPVAQAAGCSISLPVEDERIGAKTKGVSATVVALMLLALSVGPDRSYEKDMLSKLERICTNMPENLDRALAWSDLSVPALLPYRHLYVLGCGDGVGAAREGALKILETGYLPVSWYAMDEYLHGIQNALDESACLICLLPQDGENRRRMLRLIDFAQSVGARCAVIAPEPAPYGAMPLRSTGDESLCSLEYLPALQTLAAALSDARGIDTLQRRYPYFYSRMGSKLNEDLCPKDH